MKKCLFLLLSLLSFFQTRAQTIVSYRISTLPNSTTVGMAIYSDGSRRLVSSLPAGLSFARKGDIVRLPYAPEAIQTFNPNQFGSGKYFSPSFGFSVDFNPGNLTPTQRKAQGVNLFNQWSLSTAERNALGFGDGMLYLTEAGLHDDFEGANYYERTLEQYENQIWGTMPAAGYGDNPGCKLIVFNIETSNDWNRSYYDGSPHWGSWDSAKTHSVLCESDGVTRTLQQIDDQNLWATEAAVRRANRRILMHKVAHAKGAPGVRTSDGSSMYQGGPREDFKDNSHGIFLDGSANVSHINNGAAAGTITLNGRTYTGVTGSHWAQEDLMTGYYYLFNFDISRPDYNDIWVNKLAGTQNYPYVWSKIKTRHIVADEKGYLQLNRMRMLDRQGAKRGILRMQEPMYEGDAAGVVDNTYPAEIHRIPFAELQNSIVIGSYVETPKVWQPPYLNYSRYCVTRFFAGNDPNWGYYVFPTDPAFVRGDLSAMNLYKHHLHGYTTLFQAREDMQPYEQWYTGSTLVEDPEVQLNATGSFSAYDGTDAYNYSDGVTGTQKPAYLLRWKATADGWRVLILGGMNQGWTDERTDIVRVPGSGLNANQFKVKLRGPAAQVYEFAVKSSDTGQLYEALPAGNTAWERPGYAGRIGVVTSTTTSSGTATTPTAQTITIPAFSQTISYVNVTATSSFSSTNGDGGHHLDNFITAADWADYTITGAPITAPDYKFTIYYKTNFVSGSGQGTVVVNGTSVDFDLQGADGGNRTSTELTIPLNIGNNTIRVQGKTNTFFQNSITVTHVQTTTVINGTVTSSTGTSGTTTGGSSSTLAASLSGGYGEGSVANLLALAPFVPSNNQKDSYGYGGMFHQFLDNGTLKLGFAKGLSGALDYLSYNGGANLINNNSNAGGLPTVEGDKMSEKGRLGGVAPYGSPGGAGDEFTDSGQTTIGIGWNGVQAGSNSQFPSSLLFFERRSVNGTDVLYYKTQPQQWDLSNVLTKSYIHAYYWLESAHVVRFYYVLENFRTDTQMHFVGRGQELPFLYLIAPYYNYFLYNGNSPGTGGSLTRINKSQPVEGSDPAVNQNDTGEFNSTENWIGALNADNNGVFIVTPYNSRFNGKQFQSWTGDATTNASAYIHAVSTIPFDLPGTAQAFTGYFYVGNLADFRTWYNSTTLPKMPLSFSFTAGKTTGWYSGNGPAKFNSDNRYSWSMSTYHDGNPNDELHSPWGTWKASDITTLYIKGKFTGITGITLTWEKADGTSSSTQISVTGDGSEETHAVNTSGLSGWSGYIARLKIGHRFPYPTSLTNTETFVPTYIGVTNPN